MPQILEDDSPAQNIKKDVYDSFFCKYFGWMVAWSNACIDNVTLDLDNSGIFDTRVSKTFVIFFAGGMLTYLFYVLIYELLDKDR